MKILILDLLSALLFLVVLLITNIIYIATGVGIAAGSPRWRGGGGPIPRRARC